VFFLKGIGDVLEKDEPQNHVLIFRRVHVAALLVRHSPERGLKAEGGAVGILFYHIFWLLYHEANVL